jgi:HEAT repeat protein
MSQVGTRPRFQKDETVQNTILLAISLALLCMDVTQNPSEDLRKALQADPLGLRWPSHAQDVKASFPPGRGLLTALISCLKDDDRRVRRGAANALGQLHPPAVQAITPLVSTFQRDEDAFVRYAAIEALHSIAGDNALKWLTEALTDQSPDVRAAAARFIGYRGESAVDALPALTKLLNDSDSYGYRVSLHLSMRRAVRYEAVLALGRIGGEAASVLATLHRMLENDQDPLVQCAAAFSIAKIDPDDGGAVAYLADILRGDAPEHCRSEAADRLSELGERAESTVPVLIDCLRNDASSYIRLRCVEILPKVNGAGEETVSLLTSALSDDASDVQGQVLETLEDMRGAASIAAPKVIAFLRDILGQRPRNTSSFEDVRVAALRAILNIADAPSAASALLHALWNAPCYGVHDEFMYLLDSPVPKARDLVTELEKELAGAEPEMAELIEKVIRRIEATFNRQKAGEIKDKHGGRSWEITSPVASKNQGSSLQPDERSGRTHRERNDTHPATMPNVPCASSLRCSTARRPDNDSSFWAHLTIRH